jgi:uncharacterized membrane protein
MCSSIAPSEARAPEAARTGVMLRVGGGLIGLAAYQVLAHWAATVAAGAGLVALVALLPLAAIALWAAFRRGTASACAALAGVCGVAALWHAWPPAGRILPLLPQLAICLGLAWMFGRTLLAGREPLVTRIAGSVHGVLPAPIVAYTRNVTLAWTVFLSSMAVISALLYAFAPLPVWSLFANLLFLPLVALMFLGEYAHRTLRYAWFSHASIAQSVGAFRRLHRSGSADQRAR